MDLTVAMHIMTIYENPAYTSTTAAVHNFTSLILLQLLLLHKIKCHLHYSKNLQ